MSEEKTSLRRAVEDTIKRHGMGDWFSEGFLRIFDEEYERHRAPQRERLQHEALALWATGELRKRGITDVEVIAETDDDSLWFEATKLEPGEDKLQYFVQRANAWEIVGLVLWLEGKAWVRRTKADGRISATDVKVWIP